MSEKENTPHLREVNSSQEPLEERDIEMKYRSQYLQKELDKAEKTLGIKIAIDARMVKDDKYGYIINTAENFSLVPQDKDLTTEQEKKLKEIENGLKHFIELKSDGKSDGVPMFYYRLNLNSFEDYDQNN